MAKNSFIILVLSLILLISSCSAQLGTYINSPPYNSTVKAGEKVSLDFGYQNMGTGNYSVNITIWTDNTLKTPAKRIVDNYKVKPGNSTGTKLSFYMNDTYVWTVPKDLNRTFYLTVTTLANLENKKANYSMRSSAIVLHFSSAMTLVPQWTLLPMVFAVLYMVCGL